MCICLELFKSLSILQYIANVYHLLHILLNHTHSWILISLVAKFLNEEMRPSFRQMFSHNFIIQRTNLALAIVFIIDAVSKLTCLITMLLATKTHTTFNPYIRYGAQKCFFSLPKNTYHVLHKIISFLLSQDQVSSHFVVSYISIPIIISFITTRIMLTIFADHLMQILINGEGITTGLRISSYLLGLLIYLNLKWHEETTTTIMCSKVHPSFLYQLHNYFAQRSSNIMLTVMMTIMAILGVMSLALLSFVFGSLLSQKHDLPIDYNMCFYTIPATFVCKSSLLLVALFLYSYRFCTANSAIPQDDHGGTRNV